MPVILTTPFIKPGADPVGFDALVASRSPRWYLKMNDASGPSITDEQPNRTWTSSGTLTFQEPAIFGTGIKGSSDGEIRSDSESSVSGDISLEFLIKPDIQTGSPLGIGRVFQRPQSTTPGVQMGWVDYDYATGQLTWTIVRAVGGAPTVSLTHSTPINDNQWHHVVCTANSTTRIINVYIDNVGEQNSTWPTGILNNPGGFNCIFHDGDSQTKYFEGTLDFMVMYYFEMTPTDVADSFNLTGL